MGIVGEFRKILQNLHFCFNESFQLIIYILSCRAAGQLMALDVASCTEDAGFSRYTSPSACMSSSYFRKIKLHFLVKLIVKKRVIWFIGLRIIYRNTLGQQGKDLAHLILPPCKF